VFDTLVELLADGRHFVFPARAPETAPVAGALPESSAPFPLFFAVAVKWARKMFPC